MEWYVELLPGRYPPTLFAERYRRNIIHQNIIHPNLFSEHGDLADVGGGFSLAAGGSDYGQDG